MRARTTETKTVTSAAAGNVDETTRNESDQGAVKEEPLAVNSLDDRATSTLTLVSFKKKKPRRRNYFWCPIKDCASRPVKKIGQHLQKVHKLEEPQIGKLAKLKRRAPPESVKLKLPNPAKQSSGIKPIALFLTPPVNRLSSRRLLPLPVPTTMSGPLGQKGMSYNM